MSFLLTVALSTLCSAHLPKETTLEGEILLIDGTHSIVPGQALSFEAKIKNLGCIPSDPSEVQIRYVLIPPFSSRPDSMIFKTEWNPLPSIKPGEVAIIKFKTPHQFPSLDIFLRDNWGLRQYELVIKSNGIEFTLSTLTITYSTVYYPALQKEHPTSIPCTSH